MVKSCMFHGGCVALAATVTMEEVLYIHEQHGEWEWVNVAMYSYGT